MVIWIIGLAGAGKTTVAKRLLHRIKHFNQSACLIDGDSIRMINDNDLGYTEQDRKKNATRIRNQCKLLEQQGFDVIVPILSNFEEDREWNRHNYHQYIEVFIELPIETILARDQKNLYSQKKKNVVGVDIPFNKPKNPDIILNGSGGLDNDVDVIFQIYLTTKSYHYHMMDNRENSKTYMFSRFYGFDFIESYKKIRKSHISCISQYNQENELLIDNAKNDDSDLSSYSLYVYKLLQTKDATKEYLESYCDKVLSTFEIKKRLYILKNEKGLYSEGREVTIEEYILASYIVSSYFQEIDKIDYGYFSSFLKLNDLLIYLTKKENIAIKNCYIYLLKTTLNRELSIIKQLEEMHL